MLVMGSIDEYDRSMELQQLRYVVAVAETNNFTRAAERCLVVQSALSHQIARLERELGTRLFERTSRRVRLTSAGAAFLPAARQCLDAARRAADEVAAVLGEVRGELRVGVIPVVDAIDVPKALHSYRRHYPHVSISLRGGVSEELIEKVRNGQADVAFLGLPADRRPAGVGCRELKRDRLVAVTTRDHPLAQESHVSLKRLATETFVDWPAGTAGRLQADEAFAAAGLNRTVAFEVSDVDHVARFVRQGLGVALLPAAYAHRVKGLTAVDVTDAPVRVEWVAWSEQDRTPAASAFLDLLDRSGIRRAGPAVG